MQTTAITVRINGIDHTVDAGNGTPLIDVLRNLPGLKGTKFGCGTEQCGACMVLIDGKPSYSCTMPLEALAGRSVTTVEGLGTRKAPHALQEAFIADQAAQCGYCTAGFLVSAAALLARSPHPSESEVREALDRNLCRCGAYQRVVRAVLRASHAKETA